VKSGNRVKTVWGVTYRQSGQGPGPGPSQLGWNGWSGEAGTVSSSQRGYGELGTVEQVEQVEPESAVVDRRVGLAGVCRTR
jgi:hypothetical protein